MGPEAKEKEGVTAVPTVLSRLRDNVLAPFEAGIGLFPFVAHEIRIEQLVRDGRLVVRAEIPGLDPAKDIDVTITDGALHIRAERTDEKRERAHSEFRYGQLGRVVPLPREALEETAIGRYEQGILEVSFELGKPERPGRQVRIEFGPAPTPAAAERHGRSGPRSGVKEVVGRSQS